MNFGEVFDRLSEELKDHPFDIRKAYASVDILSRNPVTLRAKVFLSLNGFAPTTQEFNVIPIVDFIDEPKNFQAKDLGDAVSYVVERLLVSLL